MRLYEVHGEKITPLVINNVVTSIEYSLGTLKSVQNFELSAFAFCAQPVGRAATGTVLSCGEKMIPQRGGGND